MAADRLFWLSALALTTALVVTAEILRAVAAVWRAQRWERMVALATLLSAWGGGSAILMLYWWLRLVARAGPAGRAWWPVAASLYVAAGILVGWGSRRLSRERGSRPAQRSEQS